MSSIPVPPNRDMQLEVVVTPVADVERSKRFYTGLVDADFAACDTLRIVQITMARTVGKSINSLRPMSTS